MKDCANARRKRLPQMPAANLRCRVLPRVRPPAANARRKRLRGNTYPGVSVLHEVI